MEVGAEDFRAVVGAHESPDDVARDHRAQLGAAKPVSIVCEISVLISMTSPRFGPRRHVDQRARHG